MTFPLLRIDSLTLAFAGLKALDDVSLSVPEGSLHAIIGPNGAGKSSLFNCISGVYRPERGRILFGDRELTRMAPHAVAEAGVARVFQNPALFRNLTVLENLLVGRHHLFQCAWWEDLLWLPRTRREEVRHRERCEEVMDFLDLERWRKMPAGLLPYGVLRRADLGRALCMEPRLLLLDEPAAGLNQEETEDLARYLLDVKEELGITQVLIEHRLGLVLDLADRVTVLDFGRVIAEGPPQAIRTDPAVAEAYLGTTASGGGAP